MNFQPLSDALLDVWNRGQEKLDYNTTYGDLFDSMKVNPEGFTVKLPDAELMMTKGATKQFVKDRLGGSPSIVNDKDLQPKTKMAYMRDKASGFMDKPLAVRRTGTTVDAILSEQYTFFDNTTLVTHLMSFAQQGEILPPINDLYAHTYWSDTHARNVFMRIISPDHWNFQNGETFYGAIAFSNNETGIGSLQVSPALARVACFNYTVAESRVDLTHRWSNTDEMVNALKKGIQHIQGYSKTMFEKTQQGKSIEFDNPVSVFELLSKRLKFPSKVKEETLSYWNNEGEDPTLYGIQQAITWGVQQTTDVQGRKKPKWEIREQIERMATDWTDEIIDLHTDGEDVNRWVSESELVGKSRVLNLLKGNGYKDAANVVEGVEASAWL